MGATTTVAPEGAARFKHWLLAERIKPVEGPERGASKDHQQPWWKIVCLTGVDYFSTLGYIPGIATLAAGVLSPIATLLIVALTLFAMAPMLQARCRGEPTRSGLYRHAREDALVLARQAYGARIARLPSYQLFKITITFSASDAAVHLAENPLVPTSFRDQELLITLVLVAVLGGVFLKNQEGSHEYLHPVPLLVRFGASSG